MIYSGTIKKSPCHFSRSRETLVRIGAVGISPVLSKGELPIRIEVHCKDGKAEMSVSLVGGKE